MQAGERRCFGGFFSRGGPWIAINHGKAELQSQQLLRRVALTLPRPECMRVRCFLEKSSRGAVLGMDRRSTANEPTLISVLVANRRPVSAALPRESSESPLGCIDGSGRPCPSMCTRSPGNAFRSRPDTACAEPLGTKVIRSAKFLLRNILSDRG
jgi:hypothetical protein